MGIGPHLGNQGLVDPEVLEIQSVRGVQQSQEVQGFLGRIRGVPFDLEVRGFLIVQGYLGYPGIRLGHLLQQIQAKSL